MNEYKTVPINIKGIIPALEENTLKKGNEFPYAGMWLFSGSQGNGKTLLLMHMVKEITQEYPDCMVISNIAMYGIPSIPYSGIEDFEKYNNGHEGIIFVIDEIHTLFNSLESANMPLSKMQVWCQNRKNRRLILGTSQRFTRVAKGVREQCTYNYDCKRLLPPILYSYRVKLGEDYDDDGKYTGEAEPPINFYVPNVSVMRMYSTLEIVKREMKGAKKI